LKHSEILFNANWLIYNYLGNHNTNGKRVADIDHMYGCSQQRVFEIFLL